MARVSRSKEAPKLPQRVVMGPYSFLVSTDKDRIFEVAGETVAGVSSLGKGLIGVIDDPENTHAFKADTLLHELIHLAFAVSGFVFNEKQDEEAIVLAVTTALLHCLRENPGVINYLTYKD